MWSRGGWMAGVLVVALAACGGGGSSDHNPGALFPARANQSREDQERRIGEAATVGGYSATVTATFLDPATRTIRVDVEITNRDEQPQRVDARQWTLVNPRVQTIEAAAATFPSPELAGDATVSASVSFTVDPDELGDYYIQYKPEGLDAAKGIWLVTVD